MNSRFESEALGAEALSVLWMASGFAVEAKQALDAQSIPKPEKPCNIRTIRVDLMRSRPVEASVLAPRSRQDVLHRLVIEHRVSIFSLRRTICC
ncbi:MAG: hypothetical protein HY735_00895 [Verrucomicrobia bacterium]|nr:hypothetical protein [Verrucomicrobiota bacterium]